MSDLPYFKFMVGDWLSGDIHGHDMETQGVFINLCARIWKEGGALDRDDAKLARLLRVDKQKLASALQVLIDDGCLVITEHGKLSSKFILLQLAERGTLSEARARAGRKGGKAKQLARRSKCKAKPKQKVAISESEAEAKSEPESEIPAPLRSPEFLPAWEDWKQHRKEIKKALKPTTAKAQLKKLAKWGTAKAEAAIRKSIECGWTGLFEPDGEDMGGKREETDQGILDYARQLLAIWKNANATDEDVPRLYKKARDNYGPGGVDRVKDAARVMKDKARA